MCEVKIRRMSAADAAQVFAIAQERGLEFWKKEDYELEAQRGDGISVVAVVGARAVGFAAMRLITKEPNEQTEGELKHTSETESEAEIYNIAVKREFTKQGIGGRLLEYLFEEARLKARTGATVWLEVRESNCAAISFYRAHGFQIFSRRKSFYERPKEDALVLKARVEGFITHRAKTDAAIVKT